MERSTSLESPGWDICHQASLFLPLRPSRVHAGEEGTEMLLVKSCTSAGEPLCTGFHYRSNLDIQVSSGKIGMNLAPWDHHGNQLHITAGVRKGARSRVTLKGRLSLGGWEDLGQIAGGPALTLELLP